MYVHNHFSVNCYFLSLCNKPKAQFIKVNVIIYFTSINKAIIKKELREWVNHNSSNIMRIDWNRAFKKSTVYFRRVKCTNNLQVTYLYHQYWKINKTANYTDMRALAFLPAGIFHCEQKWFNGRSTRIRTASHNMLSI